MKMNFDKDPNRMLPSELKKLKEEREIISDAAKRIHFKRKEKGIPKPKPIIINLDNENKIIKTKDY